MSVLDFLRRALKPAAARAYDGAQGGRRWAGASEMPAPIASALAARGPLARRARGLVANNALAASGAEAWVSALAGTGIRPQSTHPDATFREAAAARWEAWTDRADLDGLADAYGLQALAARRMVVDGESIVLMSYTAEGELRLRVLDAEQLDPATSRDINGGRRIIAGVELDANGSRLAYHLLPDPPSLPFVRALDAVRVPAETVCHVFRPEVPGAVRGVSWFAPVMLRLHDLDAAHDAQLVRQKVAALLAGFIVTPDGSVPFEGAPQAGNLDGGLEPGVLKALQPGQDVRFSDPAKVGAEVIDFLRITAREIASGLGVPYETLTGDLTSVNYSSIRAGLVDFRRRAEAIQHNVLVFRMLRPIWRAFITAEVLSGRLPAQGFERDPESFLGARWMPPAVAWVDPKNDAEADIAAISAGLQSRRQVVEARLGMSVEELDRERAADAAREAALGIAPVQKETTPNA